MRQCLTAESRLLFLQKRSIIDVQLGSKYASGRIMQVRGPEKLKTLITVQILADQCDCIFCLNKILLMFAHMFSAVLLLSVFLLIFQSLLDSFWEKVYFITID